jgi:hypothetical protein
MKALNNYPRRRNAKWHPEARRQRFDYVLRVEHRRAVETMPASVYGPLDMPPYPEATGRRVQFVREGGTW